MSTPTPPDGAGRGSSRLKDAVASSIEANLATLGALADAIHDDPELCFEEHRSARRVADVLEEAGLHVELGIHGLPTALRATAGHGPLRVVLCAEYDALAEVGHACGHNLIAASAVGAGIALAGVADELGLEVTVLGTPAEEGGGGKVLLLDAGAFDGVHAALMAHPWPEDHLRIRCLAVDHLDVAYRGREAHASAAPWEGVNAGDAMVVAQVALGLLRQQLRPGDQVHGVTESAGCAANVIPAEAHGRFMVRATDVAALEDLRPRVTACFEAGALAAGAGIEIRDLSPRYTHFEAHEGLLAAWRANAEALGRSYDHDAPPSEVPTLSTDMANVSLAVPSIHPMIGVDAHGAVNHQPAFAAACVGPSANRALHDAAIALAWTTIDAVSDGALRDQLLAATG